MTTHFLENVSRFPDKCILVAGDILLDHYISGTTERTSPEAPVPVVLVCKENWLAGGAANVARNLAAAGAPTICAGIVGMDDAGDKLRDELSLSNVDTAYIMAMADCQTIVKTRIVSQGQQIVRLDYERPLCADEAMIARITDAIGKAVPKTDSVIVSDYGKGFFQDEILKTVLQTCNRHNVPVFVDPKGRDYSRYRGAFAITPNSREAHEATGIATDTEEGLRAAAQAIHVITDCAVVIITRGADGLALRSEDGSMTLIPTSAREVFDVTGAGDTFVAWLTMGMASGLTSKESAGLANIAAGISVARTGPAVVTPLDIRQALVPGRLGKKIIDEDSLGSLGKQLRAQGKKIVLANGCFDFLHAGHVAFLQQARQQGSVLIVATNSDASISRLKGASRPIIGRKQREELLASIEAVDFVTIFKADTPHEIIRSLRPDVLVKGGNYSLDQVEGAELVQEYGGEVVTLPILHDFHTGQLIKDRE